MLNQLVALANFIFMRNSIFHSTPFVFPQNYCNKCRTIYAKVVRAMNLIWNYWNDHILQVFVHRNFRWSLKLFQHIINSIYHSLQKCHSKKVKKLRCKCTCQSFHFSKLFALLKSKTVCQLDIVCITHYSVLLKVFLL